MSAEVDKWKALWDLFFQGFLVEQKSWQGNSVYSFNVDQWKIVISRRKAHSSHSHPHNFSLTQRALLQLNKSIIFLLRRKIPFEDNGKVYHIQSRAFYCFKNVEEYVNACLQVLLKKVTFFLYNSSLLKELLIEILHLQADSSYTVSVIKMLKRLSKSQMSFGKSFSVLRGSLSNLMMKIVAYASTAAKLLFQPPPTHSSHCMHTHAKDRRAAEAQLFGKVALEDFLKLAPL